MIAIILAAGKGERLNPISGDKPKCLIEMDGVSLIERQIRILKQAAVRNIAVVVGYGADQVRDRCGNKVAYIENSRHGETNSLYSLWLARHLLSDGFVVLNADVLFHDQILHDLISAPYDDALLVSYDPATVMGQEEMKVKVRKGLVVDMSKDMDPVDADGENVGIVKFGPVGAKQLLLHMNHLIAEGSLRAWTSSVFREFARSSHLHAISTRGYPWIEIDFPEDYWRAREEVFPKIRLMDECFPWIEKERNPLRVAS